MEYLDMEKEYYFYSSESEMEDRCSYIASDEKPTSGKSQATEPAEDWGEPACKYRKST